MGRERGFNVTDIEPFPSENEYMFDKKTDDKKTWEKKTPDYTDYEKLEKMVQSGEIEPFDFIISNAVLNVIPQDTRDNLTVAMGNLLAPGGQMFVNVINKDYAGAMGSKAEIQYAPNGAPTGYVRTAEGDYTSTGNTTGRGHETFVWKSNSVQKVFSYPELTAYLQDALGPGYTVEPYKKFGMTAAMVTKDGGKETIRYSSRPTTDSTGRELSEGQKEYFKDSKIRDKYGNLLTLYHGTAADFTVFDLGRSGKNYAGWSEYGSGIYLTPDKKFATYFSESASLRGGTPKLMELYANIKNPFNVNDPVTVDVSEYAKKYKLTEDDVKFLKKNQNQKSYYLPRL